MPAEFNCVREFGRFRLDTEKRVLWADGEPVTLPLKEIEILSVLTANGREVVTKEELLERVWGDSFVEESNLSQHIYRLRKTFRRYGCSADLIQTIPRRGYRFTGDVTVVENERLVIEKHTLTRTLIEEIDSSDPGIGSPTNNIHPKQPRPSVRRINVRIAVTATVALAVIALAVLVYDRYLAGPSTADIRSLAVLPLRSVNNSEGEHIRSAGLSEALITRIGRIGDLKVVSLLSAGGQYQVDGDAPLIGRRIGADTVLDGTIEQVGDEVRVGLRLWRSKDGVQIWSTTLQENAADIFKLQDAIALETSRALARSLRPDSVVRLTENGEAYEAFLRGRFFLDKRLGDHYPRAKAEFERAIAIDPRFAAAYSGLADVFALQANITSGTERDSLYNSSKAMALKALEIDPASAHARTSLAWVKRVHEWNWQGAEEDFRKAIELDPNYVTARQWYALLLTTLGRHDEALFQMEQARALEPLSKSVILNYFAVRQYRGDIGELPAIAEQAESLEQTRPTNTRLIAAAYYRSSEYPKLIEFGESLIAGNAGQIKSDYIAAQLAVSYFRIGDLKNTRRFIEHLERRSATSSEALYRLALVHSATGDNDAAIRLLELCLDARDDRMVWIGVEPEFQGLRNDPRFKDLTARMRLS
jgi:DNA-binding winged helix-turn-helix (wHTH) protein/TolB-like protein